MKYLALLLSTCALLCAQTQVDLGKQGKDADFSAFPFTKTSGGASLPATCSVGSVFYLTTATAGANLYGCTATNTWTAEAGGGGGGGGLYTLTMPGIFTVTPSGATSAATVGLVSQSASRIWASPCGAAGTPTFRILCSGDLPLPTTSAPGAVQALVPVSHFFLTGISTGGAPSAAQPAFTDLLGSLSTAQLPAFIGDATSSAGTGVLTLATVNSNVGTFGDATHCASLTVDGKGRITAASQSLTCPGGGGGGSGNATSIQSFAVAATTPTNNQALLYNTSSSAYVPTSIFTLANGLGTTTSGTTNLQINVSMGIRAVSGTTDTIQSTDCGGLVTYNSSSPVAVALPQPALGGNFLAGCPITVRNYGSGTVTLTPSSSTIGGSGSQAVNANKGCLAVSDGSNWQLGSCN